jgi:hypothetical protein
MWRRRLGMSRPANWGQQNLELTRYAIADSLEGYLRTMPCARAYCVSAGVPEIPSFRPISER